MLQTEEKVYSHECFGELNKKDLKSFLDSLANIQYELDRFDLWEVENMLSGGTKEEWNKKAMECFAKIRKEKLNFDNKLYRYLLN